LQKAYILEKIHQTLLKNSNKALLIKSNKAYSRIKWTNILSKKIIRKRNEYMDIDAINI
jgi:hypothetical protein